MSVATVETTVKNPSKFCCNSTCGIIGTALIVTAVAGPILSIIAISTKSFGLGKLCDCEGIVNTGAVILASSAYVYVSNKIDIYITSRYEGKLE